MTEDETRLGLAVLNFTQVLEFERWLRSRPSPAPGIWLRLAKKGRAGITRAEAVDAALCHGWIDGQQHPYDADTWLTRFTPRRPGSRWSQVNRARTEQLMAQGRLSMAGLAEVKSAQVDGRWAAAYPPASTARPCAEFQAALNASASAAAAYASLSGAHRYAMLHRLANLKTSAGRARRIAAFIATLEGTDSPS